MVLLDVVFQILRSSMSSMAVCSSSLRKRTARNRLSEEFRKPSNPRKFLKIRFKYNCFLE